jgi:hypothetical protein
MTTVDIPSSIYMIGQQYSSANVTNGPIKHPQVGDVVYVRQKDKEGKIVSLATDKYGYYIHAKVKLSSFFGPRTEWFYVGDCSYVLEAK